MYDNWTGEAKEVLKLAEEVARDCNSELIGTDHLLVGIIQQEGIGTKALRNCGLDLESVHPNIYKGLEAEDAPSQISPTLRSMEAIQRAKEEAHKLGHDHVKPEHLLLSLLQDEDCVATEIIEFFSTPEKVRQEIMKLLETKE